MTKPTIDLCCGGRMFHYNKNNPLVDYNDIRRLKTNLCDGRVFVIDPDTQYDFTNLPIKDETYYGVIFDPPHLIGESSGWQKIKYGHLAKNWKETLAKGFAEAFRILKPYGWVWFKWNDQNINVAEVLALTPYQPITWHRFGKGDKTILMCFMKAAGGEL